jgi:RimJ/RimL family protein N-acetyltransferase
MSKYLVYTLDGCSTAEPQLKSGYSFAVWRPGITRIIPPDCGFAFSLLWLAHYGRLFRNRDYAVLRINDGDQRIHRSCIVPACPRWPFMAKDDLQISSTWTATYYRGQGLATIGLKEAVYLMKKPGRKFWYVSREENLASVAVCKKAGFTLVGRAERIKRLGIRMLGQLVLD